jgi:predicted GIY-YIG superfamily endonuclease
MVTVYLIHIDPPFAGKRHYIGMTRKTAWQRFHEHEIGRGCKSTKRAVKAGSKLTLICEWYGVSFRFEEYVKRKFRPAQHCPICCGCSFRDLEKFLDECE